MRKFGLSATIVAMVCVLTCCRHRVEAIPTTTLSYDGDVAWEGWTKASITADSTALPCHIHCRGGSSSRYYKHSYAVKLDENYPFLGMPADKDWILNASFIDKTFLRHKLAYDIFRSMHPANRAPLCRYTELEACGRYEGLYIAMQKLDASTLGIYKEARTSVIFKEPPFLFREKMAPQDTANYYQQTYPKKHKDDRTAQADALWHLVFSTTDSVFEQTVHTVFDLRNIADWHILLLLTNNSDGILKNFFLYKVDDETPFRIAPWDYDHSFGRDSDGEYNMLFANVDMKRNMLVTRLMKMENYRQLICNRWDSLRAEGTISERTLMKMVDHDASMIRNAALRNAQKWPVNDPYFFDSMDFDEEVAIIKSFITLNIPRLDNYFAYNKQDKINVKK